METTSYYLILSAILFTLGSFGVLIRRNMIIVFMCIELMLNAVNISLVALAQRFHSLEGHVYVFLIMAVAAAEAAVGLGIIISVFRNHYTVKSSEVDLLRG